MLNGRDVHGLLQKILISARQAAHGMDATEVQDLLSHSSIENLATLATGV